MNTLTDEDRALRQAIFHLLLDSYPAPWTTDELTRAVSERPWEFAEQDAVENALVELRADGLVHREGRLVFPTRAAIATCELYPL